MARNIRAARKAAGLTQHALAVEMDRGDAMTISRWERGTHAPSLDNLVLLATVLDRDISWFYTDHDKAVA